MPKRTDEMPATLVDRGSRPRADDFAPEPKRKSNRPLARALTASDLIAGRYQVIRSLAEGGMGEVYEVEDRELRERVALKTILPELADDRRHIERFKREVQLARRITHPNVCRLFELGHTTIDGNEVWFLTMELLDGETLAQRLKPGKLAPEQALPIVEQLAAGLAATHASGIVHRDFKPANVVLCRDGRAVIMDFGIARGSQGIDRFGESVTMNGEFIGTPVYMAPEQVEGEDITPRADIFALGVVMYEMVTGKLPFHGVTDFATAAKRLTRPPESPRVHVPELDARWEAAILRCLEREPGQRFALAEDVPAAIAGKRVRVARRRSKRPLAIGAAIGLVAAGATGLGYHLRGGDHHVAPATPGGARPAIAVVAAGAAGEPHVLALAVAEALDEELAAGEQLRVIPGERVAPVTAELGSADARAALGAQVVATIDATVSGGNLALVVRGDGFELHADGSQRDLVALADKLASELRERIGVAPLSASDALAAHAALVTPSDAAKAYAVGVDALRGGDAQTARADLERAATLAPEQPLVHAALARALVALGYEATAQHEADRALALAGQLARTDKLVIEATRAAAAGDWVRAAELYGALWTFFPDDLEWGLELADAQSHAGRNKELESTLATMRKMPPPTGDDPRIDMAEADLAENLGDFKRERDACERAIARSNVPGRHRLLARAQAFDGWALLQLGDTKGAIAAYQTSLAAARELGDKINAAGAMVNLANVDRRQGQVDQAMQLYQDALAIYRAYGAKSRMWVPLNGVAIVLADRGDLEGAQHTFEQARDVCRETGDKTGEATALVNIGMVAQSRGKLADGRAAEEAAVGVARELADKRMVGMAQHALGGIFADLGDTSEARRRYELALAAREDGGDAAGQAATRSALAQLAVDDGKPEEAIRSAQDAAEELAKQELPDEAAGAYAVLATAQLAAGHIADAQAAIDRAHALAEHGDDKPTRLHVELARVRIAGAGGHGDPAAADAVVQQARALGLVELALEARLAAAELRHASRGELRVIAADAHAAGFEALARRAERR